MNNPAKSYAQQYAEFVEVNGEHAFPIGIEGYWRPGRDIPEGEDWSSDTKRATWHCPWPVIYEPEGYEHDRFIVLLKEMEASPFTTSIQYRGFSLHRLTGEINGSREFERDGWKWPEGYLNYIKMGVPPSRAFYRFVTSIDLYSLPKYGRSKSSLD
jgi:hypothetical protein